MSSKLTRVRLNNLADRLQAAYDAAERLNLESDDSVRRVAHEAMESIEQLEMAIGMLLADLDDGTVSLRS